jgi:hypothetical protein
MQRVAVRSPGVRPRPDLLGRGRRTQFLPGEGAVVASRALVGALQRLLLGQHLGPLLLVADRVDADGDAGALGAYPSQRHASPRRDLGALACGGHDGVANPARTAVVGTPTRVCDEGARSGLTRRRSTLVAPQRGRSGKAARVSRTEVRAGSGSGSFAFSTGAEVGAPQCRPPGRSGVVRAEGARLTPSQRPQRAIASTRAVVGFAGVLTPLQRSRCQLQQRRGVANAETRRQTQAD